MIMNKDQVKGRAEQAMTAIRGMLAGKRFVFIGDDQQMEPVVRAKHTPAWVSRTSCWAASPASSPPIPRAGSRIATVARPSSCR